MSLNTIVSQFFFHFRKLSHNFYSHSRSKWHSNPHFCGSFAYYSLRSDADDASTALLASPILDKSKKPLIQFAGEATNPHFYSTVHGAIGTGWREAQRLIDSYTK